MKSAAWPKLTVLAIIGLTSMPGYAQSLADVARQQREQRTLAPQSESRITTEVAASLRPGSRFSIAGISTTEATPTGEPEVTEQLPPTDAPSSTSVDEASETEAPVESAPLDTEEAWRAQFATARLEIKRAEQRLQLAEQELQQLQSDLLTRSDLYNREYQLMPFIRAKEQEILTAQQGIADANQALEQLRTDLRLAGYPPGWGR